MDNVAGIIGGIIAIVFNIVFWAVFVGIFIKAKNNFKKGGQFLKGISQTNLNSKKLPFKNLTLSDDLFRKVISSALNEENSKSIKAKGSTNMREKVRNIFAGIFIFIITIGGASILTAASKWEVHKIPVPFNYIEKIFNPYVEPIAKLSGYDPGLLLIITFALLVPTGIIFLILLLVSKQSSLKEDFINRGFALRFTDAEMTKALELMKKPVLKYDQATQTHGEKIVQALIIARIFVRFGNFMMLNHNVITKFR